MKFNKRDIIIMLLSILVFGGIHAIRTHTKKESKPKLENNAKKPVPVTIQNDTLYVIRTQYKGIKQLSLTCLCVDNNGKETRVSCPDFTQAGDTLVIQSKSNSIFTKTKNITLDRAIQEYSNKR